MTAETASKRPRWRAYLLLSRVSNLPTVWSNVLAGVVAGTSIDSLSPFASRAPVAMLLLSASAFYTGGMFLNDAFDAPFDRRVRPERPIPRGEVGLREAFVLEARSSPSVSLCCGRIGSRSCAGSRWRPRLSPTTPGTRAAPLRL